MAHLDGRDIVCFANDWSGDPLSKKHVMVRLARRNRVLWVNSLGNRAPRPSRHDLRRIFDKLQRFAGGLERVGENIHVLSPLAVPSYASPFLRRVNELVVGTTVRAAMRRLDFRRPLLYTFVPASAWVVDRLGCDRLIYHCVDEHSQFDGAGEEIALLEAELIRKSDLVITCSAPLQRAKSRLNANTILVRHGVELEHFARACDDDTPIPEDVASLPRPIIGFYGLVAEWVDLQAMRLTAAAFPNASLVIVGEINNADRAGLQHLHALPNVRFLGRKRYEDLPGYCKAFSVALLPFVKNELTENSNPLKLREYLAAGLPVVATDIPEAVALRQLVPDGVFLAASSEQFPRAVRDALQAGAGPSRARSRAMRKESWDAKVEEIETTLTRL